MNRIKVLSRIPKSQLKNLIAMVRGYHVQYPSLGSMTLDKDDIKIVKYWLKGSNDLIAEDYIKEYNNSFAKWNGSNYAFSFMSGREALSAAILALDLKKGDEVIVPGYTCVVVPNAFRYAGIKIKYVDIELDTFGIEASSLKKTISENTKAVLLHHLYGLVSRDYEEIIKIGKEKDFYIIEDCAQSTGAKFKGKNVGNYGDVAIYSSEQSKVFSTFTGGFVSTNNDILAKRIHKVYNKWNYPDNNYILKQLKNIIVNYYSYKHNHRWIMRDLIQVVYPFERIITTTIDEVCGIKPNTYGRKMPGALASIGLNQLKKVELYNKERIKNAKKWDKWCVENNYNKPLVIENSEPIFLRYPVLVEPEKKKDLTWALKELRIKPGVWFKTFIHPANIKVDNCPNADTAVKQCINFPTLIS